MPPARSGTSGATAHNGLLALPAELRLEIYEYLLPRRTCTLYLNQTGLLEHPTPKSGVCSMRETPPPEAVPDWTHNAHLALQLLCKSVKSEALQIFGKIVSLDLRIGKDPAWASAWMVLQVRSAARG